MRISDIRAYPIAPEGRKTVIVVVEAEDGSVGVGEASLSGHEAAEVVAIQHLGTSMIGADVFDTEKLWQQASRARFFPARGVYSAALSAIDVALWDLKATALNIPLFALLGGATRDRVQCYTHVGIEDGIHGEETVAQARRAVDHGWQAIRFAPVPIGGVLDTTRAAREVVRAAEAVREVVGDTVDLIIDVHTRFDLATARWFCRAVEGIRPLFVEDPLRSEDLDLYRSLRRSTAVPLAAGEQLDTPWSFRALISENLIDFVRADLGVVGGITAGLKLAAACEIHGVALALHNPLGLVNSSATLHLNIAVTPARIQELVADLSANRDLYPLHALTWSEGALELPRSPGLGIVVDEARAAELAFMGSHEKVRLIHPDGSTANW